MKIDFNKGNGLIPAIIQDNDTLQVLMLGYMNHEAYIKTKESNRVTFFSRSKNRLWTKGEFSGNYLFVQDIKLDCDQDSLLIKVNPNGPTCHKGNTSCFNEETSTGFLYVLESTIASRIKDNSENSYTNSLYQKGINKVAQKVGEEAVELVIEAMDNNNENFLNEAADLMYHYLILLKSKEIKLQDIEALLKKRDRSS